MRDEVRLAAEREALEIVTAARRDVRRIIVEARRELLVLTAQLHAAVEATDGPSLEAAASAPLLADPEARTRVTAADAALDLTQDVMRDARKEVRSVLGEARAEIKALTSEAPSAFNPHDDDSAGTGGGAHGWRSSEGTGRTASSSAASLDAPSDDPRAEGPVHELSLDSDLSALDFQVHDLPIPTLARILGTEPSSDALGTRPGEPTHQILAPLPPFETPRLAELRSLLRNPIAEEPVAPAFDALPTEKTSSAFEVTPAHKPFSTRFSMDAIAGADEPAIETTASTQSTQTAEAPAGGLEIDPDTPQSRLFMEDTGARTGVRSSRAFIALFAAVGALGLLVTGWWLTRQNAEPLSAATSPVVAETPEASKPAVEPVAAAGGTARAGLSLTIEARRTSWIRAQVDGRDELGRTYQAGETRHIEGARTVSIRAGDAGAVFVAVDGGTPQPLGASGAPLTRQFSAAPDGKTGPSTAVSPIGDAGKSGPSAVLTSAPAPTPAAAATKRPDARGPQSATPTATNGAPTGTVDAASGAPDASPGARPDLVRAGQQWLDAYQRRDRDAMAASGTENITVADERSVTERFPTWQGNVRRDLDQVELELTGDTALLTSRGCRRSGSVAAAAGAWPMYASSGKPV
jgi:hypothetical protein